MLQVRTQTLVKNAIVQIDATPFRQWYHQHYGVEVGLKKRGGPQGGVALEDTTDAVMPFIPSAEALRNFTAVCPVCLSVCEVIKLQSCVACIT